MAHFPSWGWGAGLTGRRLMGWGWGSEVHNMSLSSKFSLGKNRACWRGCPQKPGCHREKVGWGQEASTPQWSRW